MCGEACEKGNIHSKYECLLFQEAGHKVDTEITNAAIQEALGEEERGKGEIFKDINSYRTHIKEGGFSPYCYISTIRCIMMKGNIDKIYISKYIYILIIESTPLHLSTCEFLFDTDDWPDVAELRDHNKERRDFDPDGWEEHEIKVGIFLKDVLKIKVFIKIQKMINYYILQFQYVSFNILIDIFSRIGH